VRRRMLRAKIDREIADRIMHCFSRSGLAQAGLF